MQGFERTGELLSRLSEIGRPRVGRTDDGKWYAVVVFPSPEGITAEVKSNFNHSSPDEALQQVIDRLGGLRSMVNVRTAELGLVETIDA